MGLRESVLALVSCALLGSGAGAKASSGGNVSGVPGGGGPVHPIAERVFIEARAADEMDLVELWNRLIDEGADKVNLFVPEKIIACDVPRTLDLPTLVDPARFSIVSGEDFPLSASAGAGISEGLRFVARCYERAGDLLNGAAAPEAAIAFEDVVLEVTPEEIERSGRGHRREPGRFLAPSETQERSIQQNSEFLAGNVVVRVVLPESVGHAEDWTPQTRANAAAGAYAAALAYQSRFPNSHLNFTLTAANDVPTSLEPIQTTMDEHALWIQEVMAELGIPYESAPLMVHEYNNRGRSPGVDWVFTAFVANAVNDPNHRFADEYYTAYAFLGGPYLVIPYPAGENPYGIEEELVFSTVFQHEMGHIFWALDEYPGPINGSDCRSRTGYLNYSNMNKVEEIQPDEFVGCKGEPQLCIMWRAKEDLGRPVCTYTQGQIGVADDNGNDTPDVYDAAPSVVFLPAAVETVTTPRVDVRFAAISNAVPNQNPLQAADSRASYAAVLKDATVRINGSSPLYLTPQDGRWDETEEDLSMTLNGIPVGMTEVQVAVRNAFGRSSPEAIKRYYFPGVRFALFDVDPRPDGIRVSWNTVGETFGAALDLHRIVNAGSSPDTTCLAVDLQPKQPPTGSFRYYEFVDPDVVPGNRYRYFVRGHFFLVFADTVRYEVTSETFEAQSMPPIPQGMLSSYVSPNPFNEKTLISVRVPEPEGASSSVPARSSAASFLQTSVKVTVFDVAGRPVKTVHNGLLYSGVATLEWDGTNESDRKVPSGVYFIKTIAGTVVDVKKVIVVR
jgi:hypothetical protein